MPWEPLQGLSPEAEAIDGWGGGEGEAASKLGWGNEKIPTA